MGCDEGYKMSIHSKVRVQIVTRCLDDITFGCNKSQRGLTVTFGHSKGL